MLDDRKNDLCEYRLKAAKETLEVAEECYNGNHLKDAINRSYYASFYAIKALLAIEGIDFKRHKDVVAYFNKQYVASEIFSKDIGRKLAHLQQKREKSDYDDFYVASKEETIAQTSAAKEIICAVENYLKQISRSGEGNQSF